MGGRGGGQVRQEGDGAVVVESRSSRDETSHDDVFLEAAEVVHLTSDRCFREDAGGLLEAGSRNERVGGKRGLSDAKEQRAARGGASTILHDIVVFFPGAGLFHLLLEEERVGADR